MATTALRGAGEYLQRSGPAGGMWKEDEFRAHKGLEIVGDGEGESDGAESRHGPQGVAADPQPPEILLVGGRDPEFIALGGRRQAHHADEARRANDRDSTTLVIRHADYSLP